jgi:hypothetical protein
MPTAKNPAQNCSIVAGSGTEILTTWKFALSCMLDQSEAGGNPLSILGSMAKSTKGAADRRRAADYPAAAIGTGRRARNDVVDARQQREVHGDRERHRRRIERSGG